MIRLLYLSTFNPEISETDIELLLIDAAARNRELQVTGILAVEGPRVCQILEGDEEVVSRLFDVIRRDARHGGVESFNGRLRDKLLNETLRRSLAHARAVLEAWRRDYNEERPHSSSGG